ncbi:hypothetical protein ACFQS7_20490 [Dankookia sp. GCM10030260]|uniref:hypothetical protein n=1 Tax=Dankookia sp. GCM10030260 TaxID=3273390 RepID=UPI003613EFF1
MALSELVNAALGKSVARVARATRKALERLSPEAEAAAPKPAPRKSKGWRRHLRQAKAGGRGAGAPR